MSWSYATLIPHVPAGHPIYGLQASDLSQGNKRHASIDAMAAEYLDIIRAVQPNGPYNLLGWSFGGLVAHAVATELQTRREEVSLLALLDSYPPAGDPNGKFESGLPPPETPLQGMLEALRRAGYLEGCTAKDIASIRNAYLNNARIVRTFTPKQFDGNVLLFVSNSGDAQLQAEAWRGCVAGRIEVHEIDCEHDDMMDPDAAAKIGAVLGRELGQQAVTPHPNYRWRTK